MAGKNFYSAAYLLMALLGFFLVGILVSSNDEIVPTLWVLALPFFACAIRKVIKEKRRFYTLLLPLALLGLSALQIILSDVTYSMNLIKASLASWNIFKTLVQQNANFFLGWLTFFYVFLGLAFGLVKIYYCIVPAKKPKTP